MERYRWASWGKTAQQRQGLWRPWLASWLQGLSCFSPVESYCIESSADEKTLASLSLSRILGLVLSSEKGIPWGFCFPLIYSVPLPISPSNHFYYVMQSFRIFSLSRLSLSLSCADWHYGRSRKLWGGGSCMGVLALHLAIPAVSDCCVQ